MNNIINFDDTLKRFKNNRAIALNLFHLFSKELQEDLPLIDRAFKTNDLDNLEDHLHKLLGTCANCAAPELKQTIVHLQQLLKKKPLSANTEIHAAYAALLAAIDNFQSAIKKLR